MGVSGGQCVECGREVGLYSPSACGDDGGQSWCIVHLPDDHPQASLKLRLIDGRPLTIDSIHIQESSAGFFVARPEVIWSAAFHRDDRDMPGAWGELPTFVIPPVSLRSDILVLPRWKVYARLFSESIEPATGPLGGGSQLVLVFFCNDIASKSAGRRQQFYVGKAGQLSDEQACTTFAVSFSVSSITTISQPSTRSIS